MADSNSGASTSGRVEVATAGYAPAATAISVIEEAHADDAVVSQAPVAPLFAPQMRNGLLRRLGTSAEHVPRELVVKRNYAIYAIILEIIFCIGCLPLGATRGGLARASAIVNAITLVMACIGFRAVLSLDNPKILAHWLLIFSLCGLFLVYVVIGAALHGEEIWIVSILLLFVLTDLFAAMSTFRLFFSVHTFLKEQEARGGAATQNGAGSASAAGAVDGADGVEDAPVQRQLSFPDAPKGYCCQITHCIMRDPVFATDGFTYEREAIEKWLKSHKTSPMTNLPLESKTLIPNKSLKSEIAAYIDEQTRLREASGGGA